GEEDSGESDEEDRVGTVAIARRIGSLVEEVGLSALPDDDQAFVRGLKSDLPGSRFRITQAGTLAVWVDGSPRRYDICPDSGADLSTISSSTLAAVSPGAKILAPAKVEIQGYAGGMAQKPTGVVRLPLHFQAVNGKRVSREAEFHVVSECADGWLLGADNLAHFGFVVNLRDRVVTLADDNTIKIPLRNGKGVDPAARLLVVSRSITIPAHASALVPVRPPRQEATLQPYLFQNDDLSDQWISAGKGLRKAIDETLNEHDKLGISEPASGSFAFGVVLVRQRGKIRFCNDYRPLNKVTVDNFYPMPTNDDVFDASGPARWFSTVDMNKGYHQIGIVAESRDLTGFVTFRGLRRYERMPFGLKGAPSFFQRVIDRVLGPTRWKFALAYLDDIVIFSMSFEEHVQHISTVLTAIEQAGLTVSPSNL
ncbi:hypothetical protein CF336_g9366, partial [Tilletia laevis]